MLRILRGISFPASLTCYTIGEKNYEWENSLKTKHKIWFNAHENYRRTVKMVSKTQSDKMNRAGESASEMLFNIASPQELIKSVQYVKASYSGINRAIVDDLIKETQQSLKSNLVSNDAMNRELSDEDYNALDNKNTSIEDREIILQRHVGLKNSYKSFLISMASSKENDARDDMIQTLQSKPFTFITDDNDLYLFNTRYMFVCGVVGSILSGSFIIIGERVAFAKMLKALLSI